MMEATGFRSDVESLLASFIGTDSVRFEDFSRVYREMSFGLVFYLLEDEEVPVFIDCAYSIAREFLQSKFQFQVRVGALYLLYALFMQQPLTGNDRVKMSMTSEQWNDVIDLMMEVKEQEHHDTNFIFYQLYSSKAFYIVAHSHPVIMNQLQNRLTRGAESSTNIRLKESISLDNYLDQNLFRNIEEAHKKYEDFKLRLLNATDEEEKASSSQPNLFMCNPNFLSQITSQLTQFSEQIENMQMDKQTKLLMEEIKQEPGSETIANYFASSPATPKEHSSQRQVKMKASRTAISLPRHFASVMSTNNHLTEPQIPQTDEPNVTVEEKEEVVMPLEGRSAAKLEKTPQERARTLRRKTNTLRTRCVLSNPISNEDMFEGAISLETTGELPYTQKPIIEKKPK